jgi:hypothetical protein
VGWGVLLLEKEIVTIIATCISRLSFAALEAWKMNGKQSYRAQHCLPCTLVTSFNQDSYELVWKWQLHVLDSVWHSSVLQNSTARRHGRKMTVSGIHTYIHMYTHTHTDIHMPQIHKFVTETAGCGTNHKYTQFLQCRIQLTYYKTVL